MEEIVQEEAEMKEEMKTMKTQMEKKMTSVSNKVDSLDTKMTSVSNKVDSLDTKMTSVSNKVDSLDTKMDKVDQDVKMNGWRYLGRGHLIGGIVEESLTTGTTLSRCCQICEDRHSADHLWNGFIWNPSNNYCWCEKNDQGLDPTRNKEFMHFLKQ